MALVDEKTARHMLYAMFQQSFVFMQDVPKTADHQASRTAFLYYVDVQKSKPIILFNIYKALQRLRQRLKKEQSDRQVLVDKSERTDVKSGQARLSEQELDNLKQLKEIEDKIIIQCHRMDMMVFQLRDN